MCPKITSEKSLFCEMLDNWDQIKPSHSPRAHGTSSKIGERKIHRKEFCKSVNLKEAIRVRVLVSLHHIALKTRTSVCGHSFRHDLQCDLIKKIPLFTMSFLNILGLPTSCFSPQSPWTHTALLSMGNEHLAQATPQGELQSGRLADSTPLTRYEPKFNTPIIFPNQKDHISTQRTI